MKIFSLLASGGYDSPVQKVISQPQTVETNLDKILNYLTNAHPAVEIVFWIVVGILIKHFGAMFLRSKISNIIPGVKKT